MSRTGKIARLPKEIREQLNRRLQDGASGTEVVAWLNGLPECKKVLAEKFGGRPINEQNLSDWKQGGYEEWVRAEATLDRLEWLVERAEDVDGLSGRMEISDRLGSLVAAELAEAVQELDKITDRKERWQQLQEISKELSRLRREDHQGKRLQINRERWEHEFERECEEERKADEKERKDQMMNTFTSETKRMMIEKALGGGEYGKKWADCWHRVQNGLPIPELSEKEKEILNSAKKLQSDQGKSSQIKVNQGKI